MQGKADVGEFGGVGIARHRQYRRTDVMGALGKDLVDRPADHHLHQLVFRDLGHGTVADELPVAEHAPAVSDAEDLVELVRDEEDRLAFGFQPLDEGIEFVDFLVRQGGGGFIHDDHARVDGQGTGDGDKVFRRDAQIPQHGARVQVRVDAGKQGAGLFLHRGPVDQAKSGARGMAQKNVLGHGKIVEQDGFLMDRGDASGGGGLRGGEGCGAARHLDHAVVGLVDAGQDFHDGRFARAILADQGGNLTGIERELHIRQGAHAGKRFRDAGQAQHGLRDDRVCGHGINRERKGMPPDATVRGQGIRRSTRTGRCWTRHR